MTTSEKSNFIPYSCQNIDLDDKKAVLSVLESEYLTQGPVVSDFEDSLAKYTGAKFGCVVNSATSALHISCLALGLGDGDIAWTSPISFVASANCVLYCGAKIDFVDINPDSFNICADKLEEKLIRSQKLDILPKVLIVVHMCGQPATMSKIKRLSEKYGFKIVEDASHAIGATYNDRKVGCCIYSDLTVFSFHPVKIITSGEGGAIVSNDSELAEKVKLFRSHGITREKDKLKCTDMPNWFYEQQLLGFNYRMTDIAAALGLSQLAKVDNFVKKRNVIAERYSSLLNNFPIKLPKIFYDRTSSFHLYVVRVKSGSAKFNRDALYNHLSNMSIGVNVHYYPIYKQPYYKKLGFDLYYEARS